MSQRIAMIVLLVEDAHQESLLRRYLQRLGQENRNMRVERVVKGAGSGEQHVRQKYATEVRSLRSQLARTRRCLIVMIDADAGTTHDRHIQFERALTEAEEPQIEPDEPIVRLTSKRNVETWILCLNGEDVEELTDYRHDRRVTSDSIKSAALSLYDWTRPNAVHPPACVPSLRECLPEFHRIPA